MGLYFIQKEDTPFSARKIPFLKPVWSMKNGQDML